MYHNYKLSFPLESSFRICFQIFAFDILVDSNKKPWLLKVNDLPDLRSAPTPLEKRVKYQILMDTLKLININQKEKSRKLSLY